MPKKTSQTKMLLAWTLTLAVGILQAGCSQSVEKSVESSISANQTAPSLSAWDFSDYNPMALFRGWRKDVEANPERLPALQKSICAKLQDINNRDLTIFENELQRPSNAQLIAPCKKNLLSRIDQYFGRERSLPPVKEREDKWRENEKREADRGVVAPGKFSVIVRKKDYASESYVRDGNLGRKEVALTFDDGPDPRNTSSILASLRSMNAKAHFFELGVNVKKHPEITKRVAADGHMIGSHTINHVCLGGPRQCGRLLGSNVSYERAVHEVVGGHRAVFDVLGWVDPIFRFPYGASNSAIRALLRANDMAEIAWSVDSVDWRAQSPENLLQQTLRQVEARSGGVILFHDIHRRTAEIMPQFLQELYLRGYKIVLMEPMDTDVRYHNKLIAKP